jgi:hypothetical protein
VRGLPSRSHDLRAAFPYDGPKACALDRRALQRVVDPELALSIVDAASSAR